MTDWLPDKKWAENTPNGGDAFPREEPPGFRLIRQLRETLGQQYENLQIDEFTLANYLAGLCSPEEAAKIQKACQHSLEFRFIVEAAREGLGLSAPRASDAEATAASQSHATAAALPGAASPVSGMSGSPGAVPPAPAPGAGGEESPAGVPLAAAPPIPSEAVSTGLFPAGRGRRFTEWSLVHWGAVAVALAGVAFLGWLMAWSSSRPIGGLHQEFADLQKLHQKLQEQVRQIEKHQQQALQELQSLKPSLQKPPKELAELVQKLEMVQEKVGVQTAQLEQLEKKMGEIGVPSGEKIESTAHITCYKPLIFPPGVSASERPSSFTTFAPTSFTTFAPTSFAGEHPSGAASVRRTPLIVRIPRYSKRIHIVEESGKRVLKEDHFWEIERRAYSLPMDPKDGMPVPSWASLCTGLTDSNLLICWACVHIVRRYAGAQEVHVKVLRALDRLDQTGKAMTEYVLNPHASTWDIPLPCYSPEKALKVLEQPGQSELSRWAALYYLLHQWGFRSQAESYSASHHLSPPRAGFAPYADSPSGESHPDSQSYILPAIPAPTLPLPAPELPGPEWKRNLLKQMGDMLARISETPSLDQKMVVFMCGELDLSAEETALEQTKRIRDRLRGILWQEGDPQTRRWAAYALAYITPPQKAEPIFSELAGLLERWQEPNPVIFPAVCYALLQMPLPDEDPAPSQIRQRKLQDLEPRLRLLLYSPNPNIRYWAALVLNYWMNVQAESGKSTGSP